MAAATLSGCVEYAYTSDLRRDLFQQKQRNTVDILLVVDNSCSMVEEQDKLAANFQAFIAAFDDVDVDWQIGVTTTDMESSDAQGRLEGGADEVVLETAAGVTIDAVRWNRDWEVVPGAALQLDPGSLGADANDARAAWCLATDAFGVGDLGTPGTANRPCTGARHLPPPHAPPGSSSPGAGDIVISEFLADPAESDDENGEWVELTNATSKDLELGGVVLRDDGRNSVSFSSGTTLPADGRLVVGRSTETLTNGGAPVDLAFGAGFTLNNDTPVLSADTEDAEDIFSELVAVGTSGSPIEMGLQTAALAVTSPLTSFDNAGFMRKEANLSVIFVTDEEDNSPDAPVTYERALRDTKDDAGWRSAGTVTASAVIGEEPPAAVGDPSCSSSTGDAEYGSRYRKVAEDLGGALESICDEDFATLATELGLTASGLDVVFTLSEVPVAGTLIVTLYEDADATTQLATLGDADYTYDADRNAIVFSADQIPRSELYILAEYKVDDNAATSRTRRP